VLLNKVLHDHDLQRRPPATYSEGTWQQDVGNELEHTGERKSK
jgi:hypothetical protein